jgi:hypothetical protein
MILGSENNKDDFMTSKIMLSSLTETRNIELVICSFLLGLLLISTSTIARADAPVTKIPNDTKPIQVKQWLISEPLPSPEVENWAGRGPLRKGFDTDYLTSLGGESAAKIEAGTIITTKDGKKIKFSAYHGKDDYFDITELYGRLKNVCVYLYAELKSEKEQTIVLHVGTNDGCKLWANGKLLTSYPGGRPATRSQHTAQVTLKPGRTPILLKIDQAGGGWGAFVEAYGKTAHQNFIMGKIRGTFDLGASNQLPAIGDTIQAYIIKHAHNNWFEVNLPVKWALKDDEHHIPLDGNSEEVSFVIPDGPARPLHLIATKQLGSREIKGTLGLFASPKVEKVFAESDSPLTIGNQRELFVDHYLIHKLTDAQLVLHEPHDEGILFQFDKPWEGLHCAYFTIIKDADTYRAYYRGKSAADYDGSPTEVTCYAESKDGVNWEKPNLGIYEVMGTRDNNIVLTNAPPFCHNFSPYLDTNPKATVEKKYKALAGTIESGLFGFTSKDGIHWKKSGKEPLIRDGVFDSQNVLFWSQSENCYVCYFRLWSGPGYTGIRTIGRSTSKDFIHWSETKRMDFGYTPLEHLYTNQTSSYFRAPHIYVAIAARFFPQKTVLTTEQAKTIAIDQEYFANSGGCSDAVLMTSRGGNKYDRTFMESFIRPGIGLNNWTSRTNYPALNVVPTGENEMSIYVNQDYGQQTAHLRRYSLRLDGFASIKAPYTGGEMTTKVLTFSGKQLFLNYNTSAAGEMRVEIQDKNGNPISGFTLDDCRVLIGNDIKRVVTWKNGSNVSTLAGKEIRLKFSIKDANLYSLKFE